jgi:hypothetical protein
VGKAKSKTSLPGLDRRGFLPSGVHTASLRDIEAVFATNAHREILFRQFIDFLNTELKPVATGLELVVSGSFLSDKSVPGDIDCAVTMSIGQLASRPKLLALLNDGRDNQGRRGRIWDTWRVDIWPNIRAPGFNDFTAFFQYVGEKSSSLKNLNATDLRGIVRVERWTRGLNK